MIKAIVTDIEGTTTSIDFVYQELFPYAKARMRAFLREEAGNDEVQRQLAEVERVEQRDLSLQEAAEVLEGWMAEDRKLTPLKALQGMIWKTGYESGELKGHVYADAEQYLRRWHAEGRQLSVYSSGSEGAQRLLFANTVYGDLSPLFLEYFDTRIGGKQDVRSYSEILRRIGHMGAETLFLSDIGDELNAARAAGVQTCQLLRDDRAVPAPAQVQARDFSEVDTRLLR